MSGSMAGREIRDHNTGHHDRLDHGAPVQF